VKAPEQVSSPAAVRADGGREYVLVVDDEAVIRRFAARVLLEVGFGVHEATDGAEALEMVRGGVTDLDIVLSDIVMPRLNGVELVQTLATSYPDLPVILMSGHASSALAELGIAAPCAILPKPFPSERLLEEVRRCSGQRGRT